jgi:hypothetical protein
MSVATILSGLVSPLTDLYANRQKRKADESAAKATVNRIMTEAAAKDSNVAGQIALVNAKNQNQTWKDEYALITITAPYWVSFAIALTAAFGLVEIDAAQVIKDMFLPLQEVPEYWQDTFKIGILSALGVTVLKKART